MKRFSYANVMSTMAFFLALGGVSYAAVSIPANSVGTRQIADKSVGTNDLADRAVTSSKINPAVLTMFKGQKGDAGAVGAQGNAGPVGPPGQQGPSGQDGAQGPKGDPGATYRVIALDSGLNVTQGGEFVSSVAKGDHLPWGDDSRRVTVNFDVSECVISPEFRLGYWNGGRWYGQFVDIERISASSVDIYTLTSIAGSSISVRDSVRLAITCPS